MWLNAITEKYSGGDFIKHYLQTGFGAELYGIENARDYFIRFEHLKPLYSSFDKIYYRKGFVPQRGDICVWGSGVNEGKGLAAIATGCGNLGYFYCYEENPKHKRVKKSRCNYRFFLGVLRPKRDSYFLENKK